MADRTMKGAAEMTAAMLISGTIGLFVVASGQPATAVVFWRCVFGAASLLAVCLALGHLRPGRLSLRQALIAALGGVAIVLNWLMLFAAFPRASISLATAVYNTQPFILVGLGVLVLGERLTASRLGWLALAFAGTLAIVSARPGTGNGEYLAGVLLALGAAFFYALAALAAKSLKGVPPHLIALIQVTVGVLMLAPFADFSSPPADLKTWALLVGLGVIHTGLMYILLYGALQTLTTPMAGALGYIYPVAAIAVDHLAFGQRLDATQWLGAAAILLAAAGSTLGWCLPLPFPPRRRPAG